jgi:myo-inositol-1(or 4)-monophosphatase
MNPWDLAAGALLVEEAGGRVSRPSGEAVGPQPRDIVASNGRIHAEMLGVLKE